MSTFLSKPGLLFPFKVDLVQLKLGGGPSGGPASGGGDLASVTDGVSDERRENNEGDDSAKCSENWDV